MDGRLWNRRDLDTKKAANFATYAKNVSKTEWFVCSSDGQPMAGVPAFLPND